MNRYICLSSVYPSLVGDLQFYAIVDEDHPAGALAGVMMVGQKFELDHYHKLTAGLDLREEGAEDHSEALAVFEATGNWLGRYFAGERVGIQDLQCEIFFWGSDFRKRVWNILREIPYGETITYGEIARKISEGSGAGDGSKQGNHLGEANDIGEVGQTGTRRMSAQAVGGAVGHNPIGIIIPCHRVIGADGSLTGYAGGIEKKVILLKLEGSLK